MNVSFSYATGSLFLLLLMASCHEKDSTPTVDFVVKATKDAAPWAAPSTATYSKARKEFSILGQAGDAAKAEILTLGFTLPAWPQPTPVQALSASWRVLLGFDALTNSYATADATSLPQVEVTRLDTVNKVVEGRFQAALLREKQWTTKPETLTLEHGTFRAKYTVMP
jgi:hypothetical protein